MHPNEVDFTKLRDSDPLYQNVVDEYRLDAAALGKKYEDALNEQLMRQGIITKKTKLQA